MQKRGQITLFIILGIVIILITLIIFIISKNTSEKTSKENISRTLTIPQAIEEVNNLVDTCFNYYLEEDFYSVIKRSGRRAGYASLAPIYFNGNPPFWRDDCIFTDCYPVFLSHHWIDQDNGRIIEIQYFPIDNINNFVEPTFEGYLRQKLTECLDDFSSLQQQAWTPEFKLQDKLNVNVKIEPNNFEATLLIPAEFKKDANSFSINKYSKTSNIPLYFLFQEQKRIYELKQSGLDINSIKNIISNELSQKGFTLQHTTTSSPKSDWFQFSNNDFKLYFLLEMSNSPQELSALLQDLLNNADALQLNQLQISSLENEISRLQND